jgi:alkanesulfonate monooxygenase SsuD/methylene tetrahydromethanopterin reductase-like flavin-dependent oxidoreductase (luciferase family)
VTRRVKLGALGHLLPYHHPVSLAHQMVLLDHMTHGRYVAGVAPGAYPSDAQLFDTGRSNPDMLVEALDIIDALFHKPGPWRFEGRFWNVDLPSYDSSIAGPHLAPLQAGGPEVLMTGVHPDSPTLQEAGRRGFSPVSQTVHADVLVQHWDTYERAASGSGNAVSRGRWRISRDWLVADTDEEARDRAMSGSLGAVAAHYLELFRAAEMVELLTGGAVPPERVDVEWFIDNIAIVGSPSTVAERIRSLYEEVGGFSTLIGAAHARMPDPETWRRSWQLTGAVVAPAVADLTGA